MATHKQAKKRAGQAERRRQSNLHVKSTVRTHIKRVRYAVDSIRTLDSGRSVHPQEVEKHVKGIIERHSVEYAAIKRDAVVQKAKALLAAAGDTKKFDREKHRAFLQELAQADLYIATRSITKAASHGIYHKCNASRHVSRLSILVNSIVR